MSYEVWISFRLDSQELVAHDSCFILEMLSYILNSVKTFHFCLMNVYVVLFEWMTGISVNIVCQGITHEYS